MVLTHWSFGMVVAVTAVGCVAEFPKRPADEQDVLRKLREMNVDISVVEEPGAGWLEPGEFWLKVPFNMGQGGGWTDADLQRAAPFLKELHEPWCLDLSLTRITNDGLKELVGVKNLKKLDLQADRQFTDECVEHLAQIKSLEWIGTGGTSITDEGLRRLREALPLKKLPHRSKSPKSEQLSRRTNTTNLTG